MVDSMSSPAPAPAGSTHPCADNAAGALAAAADLIHRVATMENPASAASVQEPTVHALSAVLCDSLRKLLKSAHVREDGPRSVAAVHGSQDRIVSALSERFARTAHSIDHAQSASSAAGSADRVVSVYDHPPDQLADDDPFDYLEDSETMLDSTRRSDGNERDQEHHSAGGSKGRHWKVMSSEERREVCYLINIRGLQYPDVVRDYFPGLKKSTYYRIAKEHPSLLCDEGADHFRPRPARSIENAARVLQIVSEYPTLTVDGIVARLRTEHDVNVSRTTVYRILKDNKYEVRFKRTIPKARNDPSTIEDRFNYCTRHMEEMNSSLPPLYVFLDETGVQVSTLQRRAWTRKNERAYVGTRYGHCIRLSALSSMCSDGIIFVTCWRGSVDGRAYAEFLDNVMCSVAERPSFQNRKVILCHDNASIHKVSLVQETVNAANAKYRPHGIEFELRNLPRYSPFLNPIETLFSQVKASIRRSILGDMNTMDLSDAIRTAFLSIKPQQCQNYCNYMLRFFALCLTRQPIASLPHQERLPAHVLRNIDQGVFPPVEAEPPGTTSLEEIGRTDVAHSVPDAYDDAIADSHRAHDDSRVPQQHSNGQDDSSDSETSGDEDEDEDDSDGN
jgi:transposase